MRSKFVVRCSVKIPPTEIDASNYKLKWIHVTFGHYLQAKFRGFKTRLHIVLAIASS